jgi:hypothetical protein
MSIESLALPREATIQLSDVYGPLPIVSEASLTGGALQLESRVTIPPPDDLDAAITSQVRNTGRFHDGEYGISDGGAALGGYGVVLVDDLRTQQREEALSILENLGVEHVSDLTEEESAKIHPDSQIRLDSLGKAVVVVANSAARRSDHHENGNNGDDFYVATTESGVEVYAQAHMLSSLDARGRVETLHRVPEGVVWTHGEQFRSSVVTDARRKPEDLVPVERDGNWPIPALPDGIQVVYTDKFANVRLQTSDVTKHSEVLRKTEAVDLVLEDGQVCIDGIKVVTRLTEIPENGFGAYFNPADRDAENGPAYIELIRRVSDCNGNTQPRAYHVLSERVGALLGHEIKLSDWNNIILDVVPSTTAAA